MINLKFGVNPDTWPFEGPIWPDNRLKVLDLFAGVMGFSLGLEATGGFKTVAACEIADYPRQIISQWKPDIPIIEDIHDVSAESLRQRGIEEIDVITAGFPCQPFSSAGSQRGTADERFLWPELYRVIADIRPRYVILENVPRLLTIQNGLVFAGILYDLRQIGFDAEWQIISANDVGGWHQRKRLWIVAYPHRNGRNRQKARQSRNNSNRDSQAPQQQGQDELHAPVAGRPAIPDATEKGLSQRAGEAMGQSSAQPEFERLRSEVSHTPGNRMEGGRADRLVFAPKNAKKILSMRRGTRARGGIWQAEPGMGRVVDGLPDRVDRIKALGNAVVPQIPYIIGECIIAREVS